MSELFEKFEVNRDPRWKILTKLIGVSLVLHLAFVWLSIYVPAFRDTFNIVALVAGTKFVDKPYDATRIADDVQWIQTSDKFHYPEGYFQPGGQLGVDLPPENMLATNLAAFAPKIISLAANEKKVEPEASPSPSPQASPSPGASPVASASPSAVAQASSSPMTTEQAQEQLEKTAAQNNLTLPDETQINTKPLKDFAAFANEQKNQGKLDIDKPFEIVITAELDQNGKLKNSHVAGKTGDENLVALFVRMVEAVNDSGFLVYLQPI